VSGSRAASTMSGPVSRAPRSGPGHAHWVRSLPGPRTCSAGQSRAAGVSSGRDCLVAMRLAMTPFDLAGRRSSRPSTPAAATGSRLESRLGEPGRYRRVAHPEVAKGQLLSGLFGAAAEGGEDAHRGHPGSLCSGCFHPRCPTIMHGRANLQHVEAP
jgi:hypothetical protein